MKAQIFAAISIAFIFLIFGSCSQDDATEPSIESENEKPDAVSETGQELTENRPNILLIIGDDIGKDAMPMYSEGSIKPTMPNLSSLMSNGMIFDQFYTYPTCSPTRATILTGKYGYHTGVAFANEVLPTSETILQQYINQNSDIDYATAVIGKWHLAGDNSQYNPEELGIDYYAGGVGTEITDYYNWVFTENGKAIHSDEYITSKFTDLGIDWLQQQTTETPWFLWMAHFAPHSPFHLPPNEMHSQGNLPTDATSIRQNPLPYYLAMMESLDHEVGRLLSAIPEEQLENTIIIFIGDNGTPGQVVQIPYTKSTAKGSLFQGGINCPMIISGKNIVGGKRTAAAVQATDLFATIAELAGVSTPTYEDSFSFMPLLENGVSASERPFIYSENKEGNTEWMVMEGSYKLIQNTEGDEWLYDIGLDPYERNNLLDSSLSNETKTTKENLERIIATVRK